MKQENPILIRIYYILMEIRFLSLNQQFMIKHNNRQNKTIQQQKKALKKS